MRDPMSWSFPIGRLFGTTIRVHFLFPVFVLVLLGQTALKKPPSGVPFPDGRWIDALLISGMLFVSVLLHEFGHCFAARSVGGSAEEILMWPLGGLAYCEVPHTARANFITVACGPLVNLILCLLCAVGLCFSAGGALMPPFNPMPDAFPWRGLDQMVRLYTWGGAEHAVPVYSTAAFLARFFWLNWFLFLFNVVLAGWPLDGGKLLQAALWPYVGHRQATWYAVLGGFAVMCVIGLYSLIFEVVMALLLAIWVYVECRRQMMILETGGDESLFGYDFSQGYTSLERDQPQTAAPQAPRLSWWQRWRQRRAQQKAQREREAREADERRMDMLLEKISAQGMASITDEERRFMKQFSDRYRNRRSP
jgi:Zn-dependent protease